METIFINVSNHKSSRWSEEQRKAAGEMADRILDIAFPSVPPEATSQEVEAIADEILHRIWEISWANQIAPLAEESDSEYGPNRLIVHIMGEMVLTFKVLEALKGVATCVASTTKREAVEVVKDGSTEKNTIFKFVQFRKYY
ncbi:MAG: CRISPR-associated protein [Patescibacteria group bacterium]|nr:CRISPR-associated protein [Patescibacteria group bacterium]MDD5490843.1 CRISPR-associated protein [Patescibacteria group bacterium]